MTNAPDLRRNNSQKRRAELERIADLTRLEYSKLQELETQMGAALVLQEGEIGYVNTRGKFEFLFSAKSSSAS